jgi:serine protease Do
MRAKFFVAWLTAASRFAFAATPSDAPVSDLAAAIEHARERVFPTLVHIQPIFDVASGGRTIEASATGSGAIIREDGLVVTNFHVAGSAKRLICTLADRRKVSARLVGVDAPTDLALLRLELSELGLEKIACATFAERLPKEGEFVVAMGSPLGLTRSLSFGVVSCSQRYLGELRLNGGAATGLFNTWIQTDAAINPGNSGGPLVALDGAIVGVNSRGFDRADNLGFAIPASVVLEVIDRLLAHGVVERSSIGVRIQVSAAGSTERGALVASVESGSPAAKAGIRAGDRITRFAGQSLDVRFDEDLPDALRLLSSPPVGADVEVELGRVCETETIVLQPVEWRLQGEQDTDFEQFGLTLRVLAPDELRKRFIARDAALYVSGVRKGSVAERAAPALRVGDIVLKVDGADVADPAAFETAIDAAAANERAAVVLQVARGRAEWRIALEVPRREPGVAAGGVK